MLNAWSKFCLGGLQMACLIVGLPGCVLLFGLGDQRFGRIGLRRHIWLGFEAWDRQVGRRGLGDLGSFGLGWKGAAARFG